MPHQSDTYRVPSCLANLPPQPLYMSVAWWGLLKGSAFTATEVSQTFHISHRRATDILHYIQALDAHIVTSEKQLHPAAEKGYTCRLLVISAQGGVSTPPLVSLLPTVRSRKAKMKIGRANLAPLQQWIANHPLGTPIPDDLLVTVDKCRECGEVVAPCTF